MLVQCHPLLLLLVIMRVNAFVTTRYSLNQTAAPFFNRSSSQSSWRNVSSRITGNTSFQTQTQEPYQPNHLQEELDKELTHCNTQNICKIKWKEFVPYVFYVNTPVETTISPSLALFDRLNFSRLNYAMRDKGDAAIIAGEMILMTASRFSEKFRLKVALNSVLGTSAFWRVTQKGKRTMYNFNKKISLKTAWTDFTEIGVGNVRRFLTKKNGVAWVRNVEAGDSNTVSKVTLKDAPKPVLILRKKQILYRALISLVLIFAFFLKWADSLFLKFAQISKSRKYTIRGNNYAEEEVKEVYQLFL